ncbi:hypothetical protein [Magnetofaba australis]|uniref:Putative prolyl 4-hydroxylase subunit alpha n=1 Tax=Magnetofaba australis IT-1 TaxID=1434232 RepID=A0A1Y2K3E5_9PROT|nr:hypothetical protein [Magnetofaba australis]OSM02187.1 putative prolyl 4-hydroxylase subunit alpha [Magnetofaba australis IT-1]
MSVSKIPYSSKAFALTELLNDAERRAIIRRGAAEGYHKALMQTEDGAVYAEETRNNDRVIFVDADLAQTLYARIEPFLPSLIAIYRPLCLNDHFRLLRYAPGHYFTWHGDGQFRYSAAQRSLLTLLIYLNDDFTGGETEFEQF